MLIGDTHYDADGAKEGGIDCVGVGYGFGGAEEMWNAGAMAVYEDQKAFAGSIVIRYNDYSTNLFEPDDIIGIKIRDKHRFSCLLKFRGERICVN